MGGGCQTRTYDEDRRAHFAALADHLRARAQECAEGYWETRALQVGAHSDCLAISWSGGREYRLALAFEREWARAEARLRTAEQVSRRPLSAGVRQDEREAAIKRCRQRYATKRDAAYASESYIFQKTSEVVPDVLQRVAPGLACEIARVPLHHYYLISRDQPAVDEGESPVFVDWVLEEATYADQAALTDALLARIYPERCPMIIKDRRGRISWAVLWWTLLCILVGAAVLAAGVYVERSRWFNEITGRFDALESDIASIDASLADLNARYAALEAELADAAAHGADGGDLQAILDRLDALERAILDARDDQGAVPAAGLDHPPCSLARTDPRAPAFLLRAQIGADGIRVFGYSADPVAGAARREAALATLDFSVDQPMDAAAFRRWAEPAFRQSRAEGCRHFVILNETGSGDAATYAALRQAVEDRFYIVRVRS